MHGSCHGVIRITMLGDTMKRWHQDYPRALKQWKIKRDQWIRDHWSEEVNVSPYDSVSEKIWGGDQVGRHRKRKAFDCGNTRCCICHGDKYPVRYSTKQEIIADMDYKEQLKDYYDSLSSEE